MTAEIRAGAVMKPLDPYSAKAHEDLPAERKIKDMIDFTSSEYGGIDLLFYTNLFSRKTLDLSMSPTETNISFLDPWSGSWASFSGSATATADPETVRKVYSLNLKAWLGDLGDGVHDGGPNDPRLGVIRFQTKQATHSVATRSLAGKAYEMIRGTIEGDVPDITSLREISSEELEEWRNNHTK